MIGRIGGGPVVDRASDWLVLIFLIILPIMIAITNGLWAAVIYVVIFIGGSLIYHKWQCKKRYEKLKPFVSGFVSKTFRFGTYYSMQEYLVTKANAYPDCIELAYVSVGFKGKPGVYEKILRFDRGNIDSLEFNGNRITITYRNEFTLKDVIEI